MPELPEVEIARRQLERWLAGHRIDAVILADPGAVRAGIGGAAAPMPEGPARIEALAGQLAGRPLRHGKRIGWPFEDDAVIVHLGMTGSWVRRPVGEVPPHARLGLIAGEVAAWFVDPRRFGGVIPVGLEDLGEALVAGLGPDALDTPLDGAQLAARVAGRGPIKPALMDQRRIAGIGNIQATEALWCARLAPDRPGRALTSEEWATLAAAIPEQLRRTLDADDGDELVYASLGGGNPFRIYGRAGEPCPRCEAPIVRTILAGRATFRCTVCQQT